jgi:two-component system, NarL family, response regulator
MNQRPIRVMIVDDHALVREGIALLLGKQPDLQVVASLGDARAALEAVASTLPDVVVLDLRMPDMDGLAFLKQLGADSPRTKVIVLSAQTGDESIRSALRAGANGFVLKSAPGRELVEAIRQSLAGRPRLSQQVAVLLAEAETSCPLSGREIEVLRLAAAGASNKEIAARLALAENTVKNHIKNLLQKLNVGDRTACVTTAIRRGIIDLPHVAD